MKIGLALSGGGAKGAAHIGILKGLNELGIFPTHISGTSAGSVIGALYCSGYAPDEILALSDHHAFLKIFHLGLIKKGLTDLKFLNAFLTEVIGDKTFESLDKSFFVCATNINKGTFKIFDQGLMKSPIMASCAVPVLFRPVEINGDLYVDGGLMNNLPIEPLHGQCDKIIGVNVCTHSYKDKVNSIREIGTRCFQLAIWNTTQPRMKSCDVVIDLTEARTYGMFEFNKAQELFELGLNAVRNRREALLKMLVKL